MKMRKRIPALSLVVVMLLALLAGCGGKGPTQSQPPSSGNTDSAPSSGSEQSDQTPPSGDGKVYTMRLGAVAAPPTAQAVFITELKDIIEEATNGRIIVEAYHSGTLGTVVQMIEGLQQGTVAGVAVPANFYESNVPELGVLALPMFFEDHEQLYRICNTPGNGFHEMLAELLEAKGFVPGVWSIAFPMLLISNKPIATIEDFKGTKIWSQPNAQIANAFKALGAVPVNFDTGDLAVGLQQKTVDAAYSSPQLFGPMKLHDTAKNMFVFTTPMHSSINPIVLSKVFMDSLPSDLQEMVIETLRRADSEVYYDLAYASQNRSFPMMTDADGMSVVYSDDAMTADLRQLLVPLYEDFLASVPSARPLYDKAAELIASGY